MGESLDLYADFDFAPPCLESSRPSAPSAAGHGGAVEAGPGPGGAATAPEVKTVASVAAPLDFDLYGDLEMEAQPATSSSPTSASRTVRVGVQDNDDSEAAVSALLDFLSTTEAGDDIEGADFGGLGGGNDLAAAASGSDTEPEDGVLSVDADSVTPAAKRPRIAAAGAASVSGPGRPAAGAAPAGSSGVDGRDAGGLEDAFDFEADLQSAASRREVAAVGSAHAGAAFPGSSSAAPSSSSTSGPKVGRAAGADQSYWYNPATKRWEQGSGAGVGLGGAGLQGSRPQARRPRAPTAPGRLKGSMCRIVSSGGKCKWGNECYFAHSQAELRQPSGVVGNEHLKRKFITQCSSEAGADADAGVCDYLQALAVRLALRFEACPEELLSAMVQAGLPTGADQRTTVKALLRLCHPDKCKHPDAKKAVQILSPLLTKT